MSTMKSLGEMLELLQKAIEVKDLQMDNVVIIKETNPKWDSAKNEIIKIPGMISDAITYVSNRKDIKKKTSISEKGSKTEYSKNIYDFEFIFEIHNVIGKGNVRALLTLYNNDKNTVFIRDLLKDPVNTM